MIDVAEHDLQTILGLLNKYVPECEVRAFGSRVTWTAKDHSDLDIVVVCPEKIERKRIRQLKEAFEESSLPFVVDIMDWGNISSEFQKIIEKSFEIIKTPTKADSNWTFYKVSEFAEVIGGGTPKTTVLEYWNGNIPWITPKDLSNHRDRRIARGERNITKEGLRNSGARLVPANTVLLTSRAPVGYLAIAQNELTTNQGFRNLVVRDNFSSDFIYYLLLNNVEYLKQHASGSTFQEISGGTLKNLEFQIPDFAMQKAIAKILSDLDDKIELKHKMNNTLESMAQALFKKWFVDVGREDWQDGVLSDLCMAITKGTTPTTLGMAFTETGINFVKVESISEDGEFIFEKFAKIQESTHNNLKRSILQVDDVLCSIAGTIGRIAIVDPSVLPANANQAIAIIRVDEQKSNPYFIYLFLKSEKFQNGMDGKIVHAVQANLSLGEIGSTELKIPPKPLMDEFYKLVRPIFMQKQRNSVEISNLVIIRNLLLPRLMSGKIRIKA